MVAQQRNRLTCKKPLFAKNKRDGYAFGPAGELRHAKKDKLLEDATVQADAPDREPHASGMHGEPDARMSKLAGASSLSMIEGIRDMADKARAVMFDALLPGEHPHVVLSGASGSAIVATGERILVIKTGARSGAVLGARAKAFEYETVIGVRLETEVSPPVIVVDAPAKMASCRVYWADPRDNAYKARNAIPLERPYEPAGQAVNEMRGLLEAYRDRHPGISAGSSAGTGLSTGPPAEASGPRRVRRDSPVVKALPDAESEEEDSVVSPLPSLGERCPHCRADVRPGWRYCPKCGAASASSSRSPLR